jgi:hypothetical protein
MHFTIKATETTKGLEICKTAFGFNANNVNTYYPMCQEARFPTLGQIQADPSSCFADVQLHLLPKQISLPSNLPLHFMFKAYSGIFFTSLSGSGVPSGDPSGNAATAGPSNLCWNMARPISSKGASLGA